MTKNQLMKVVRIQEVDVFFTKKGFSRIYIHEQIIEPCFFISRSTYFNYLGVNAKAKLTKKGFDWKIELQAKVPIDYMGLMDALKDKNFLKLDTYHQMLKEGGKH